MRTACIAGALVWMLALPAAAQPAQPSDADRKDAFVLQIRDGGVLQLPDRETLTLREVGQRIEKAALAFDQRAALGTPDRTDLPLILEVEDRVPWSHAQALLRVAAQKRCHRIWIALANGEDPEPRYTNVWIREWRSRIYTRTADGMVEVEARQFPLFLVVANPVLRDWPTGAGIVRYAQPTSVAYLFGPDQAAGTLLDGQRLAGSFADEVRRANPVTPLRGILSAPSQTPTRLVIEAAGAFDRTHYPFVEFLQTPPLDRDEWDRRQLSYPTDAIVFGRTASVLGGDPDEKFLASPWALERGASPVASKQVRPIAGFDLVDAGVRLPLAAVLTPDKGPWGNDRFTINLTRRGELRLRGHQLSLQSLGAFLRGLATAHKLAGDFAALRVLLRVDGEAPWGHVQMLLTEIKHSGVRTVEFGVRSTATADDTQRDADQFDVMRDGTREDAQQHDGYFRVAIEELAGSSDERAAAEAGRTFRRMQLDLMAEREVETDWGPAGNTARVRRPLIVRFTLDGDPQYSVRDTIRALLARRAANTADGTRRSGESLRAVVSASAKVPARYVIACLARIDAMKWGEIWFFCPAVADDAARTAMFLPYPETNHPLRVVDGLGNAGDGTGGAGGRRQR